MKHHQLFKNNKNKFMVLSEIVLLGFLLFLIFLFNKNSYYLNIKNNTKNLNTSLLNNVYIEQKKEKIEETFQKENNDNKNIKEVEITKNVEQESNQKVSPASTTIDNNNQIEKQESIEGVYVGLRFTGSMTAYGKDCCGSDPSRWGITSSGYDLKQSLTYNDSTYGSVRIVASDKNFKLYSIIQVSDPIDGTYNAIVLDRAGSIIGLNKTKKFNLAVESEAYASSNYGVHRNVTFQVLRVGK